jgi:hypothetical protein
MIIRGSVRQDRKALPVLNILTIRNGGKRPVKRKTILVAAAIAGILGGNLVMVNVAQAFDMGNMMNPGKWFGDNDDDRYYRRYVGFGYGP